jgi:hypothetical protein
VVWHITIFLRTPVAKSSDPISIWKMRDVRCIRTEARERQRRSERLASVEKSIILLAGLQVSPARPSDGVSMKMKVKMK